MLRMKGSGRIVPPPANRPGCHWSLWFEIQGEEGKPAHVVHAKTRRELRPAAKALLRQITATRLAIYGAELPVCVEFTHLDTP